MCMWKSNPRTNGSVVALDPRLVHLPIVLAVLVPLRSTRLPRSQRRSR